MKLIVLKDDHGQSKMLSLNHWTIAFLSLCLLSLPFGAGVWLGKFTQPQTNNEAPEITPSMLADVHDEPQALPVQEAQLKSPILQQTANRTVESLQVLTVKVAELQARLLRLDAFSEQMAEFADLDSRAFNFSEAPAIGGPFAPVSSLSTDTVKGSCDDDTLPLDSAAQQPSANPELDDTDELKSRKASLLRQIDDLAKRIDSRSAQLELLKDVLTEQQVSNAKEIAGRPIVKGWMSSRYGMRKDPFNGKQAMHKGVDFAGKLNSAVVAVGPGIVTWSGKLYGYGQLVEINHGGGIVTRYGHNRENLVAVGDFVKADQQIAKMGSSGRSTGPHVHFEVYKNGRIVDPSSYVRRSRRKTVL